MVQRNSLDDFYVTWRPNHSRIPVGGGTDGDDEEEQYARTKLAHRSVDLSRGSCARSPSLAHRLNQIEHT